MEEKRGKQGPKPDQQDKSKESEKEGKSRVSMVLHYGGIFALLAAWAGLLGNLGHTYWIFAACVMLAASVCCVLGLRLQLRNHHWWKWQYNGLAWVIVLLAFSLGLLVVVREIRRSEPQPHLKLLLNTSQFPEINLQLTNKFLFSPTSASRLTVDRGFLVVPLQSGNSNVALTFALSNDSPVIVEMMEVFMGFPKELECVPDPGWTRPKEMFGLKYWAFRGFQPLLPGDAQGLPDIKVTPGKDPQSFEMRLHVRAKDMQNLYFGTHIVFPTTNCPNRSDGFNRTTDRSEQITHHGADERHEVKRSRFKLGPTSQLTYAPKVCVKTLLKSNFTSQLRLCKAFQAYVDDKKNNKNIASAPPHPLFHGVRFDHQSDSQPRRAQRQWTLSL